jgi:hypothetical protein
MSDIPYIDQLLKAEKDATDIIERAQKERYTPLLTSYLEATCHFS